MAVILDQSGAAILDQLAADILDQATSGSYLFSGPETLVYPSYIDTGVQHTLTAVPGETYELEPPPGTNQPAVPPDGFWSEE